MKHNVSSLTVLSVLLLSAAALPTAAAAQAGAMVQNIAPGDADRLADAVRTLATDPANITALLTAGNLSVKLGDLSAAQSFFARAEKIDPNNPRLLAGRGAIAVRMELPGKALRLFNEAEQRGVSPIEYAADRGLAYDLLGNPTLAQRDYRLALSAEKDAAAGQDKETLCRLALSLGIVGKKAEAETLLDPLLRQRDREAWRAQALVLAMNGDTEGAERIAATMLPGPGAALGPFFRRLAGLEDVADRAFAVHFGELSPTPERLADVRAAPPVPVYVPEPVAPPESAASGATATKDRRSRRQRKAESEAQQQLADRAAAAPPPPLPPPPGLPEVPMVQPLPVAPPAPAVPPPPAAAPIVPPPAPVAPTVKPSPVVPPKPTPKPATPPAKPVPEKGPHGRPVPAKPTPAKPVPAKPAPTKPTPAKAEPARIWVQVAGGAEESGLRRTWDRLVDKAPAAFRNRTGWWTPLHATNRILAGPFRTEDAAQDFVNRLHGEGIRAFVFTSAAGQKINRLPE